MFLKEKDVFLTFEGIEGCGKTTQVKRLARRLGALSIPFVSTLEPGGTRIGREIRRILLNSRNQDLDPMAELFLYAADRAQHVKEVIIPALEEGKWVLCDRFYDATTVYQGFARGQDSRLIGLLNREASKGIRPDLTFLLDCPVGIGLKRAIKRNNAAPGPGLDRFEKEENAFHERVRNGYLRLARKNPERFVVIDASMGEDELESSIFAHVRTFISSQEYF